MSNVVMMATSKKKLDQESSDVEMLLPWHAAGTLSARDARRVEKALGQDPELAREYSTAREECAEIIFLNESLRVPSPRAMQNLFAAIDAEPRKPQAPKVTSRFARFFATRSSRKRV
jgi:anti-sigma factor RsiW